MYVESLSRKRKPKSQGGSHSNQDGLPKINFSLSQTIEGKRKECMIAPPGAVHPISFSKNSTRNYFIQLLAVKFTALHSLGTKEEQDSGCSLLLV